MITLDEFKRIMPSGWRGEWEPVARIEFWQVWAWHLRDVIDQDLFRLRGYAPPMPEHHKLFALTPDDIFALRYIGKPTPDVIWIGR